MVQVGGLGVGGTSTQIGGVTAAQQANIQARLAEIAANKAAAQAASAERAASTGGNGYGNGNGAGPGAIGAFEVPNNFWGFVMLMMGMK